MEGQVKETGDLSKSFQLPSNCHLYLSLGYDRDPSLHLGIHSLSVWWWREELDPLTVEYPGLILTRKVNQSQPRGGNCLNKSSMEMSCPFSFSKNVKRDTTKMDWLPTQSLSSSLLTGKTCHKLLVLYTAIVKKKKNYVFSLTTIYRLRWIVRRNHGIDEIKIESVHRQRY